MTALAGKVAIVTGGAAGIGLASARRLAGEGMRIALLDVDGGVAERAAACGEDAVGLVCDVSDPAAAEAAVAAVAERLGTPYALVHSAGVAPVAPLLETPLADWHRVLAVNLTAAFVLAQCAGRLMAAAGAGRIVSIASISGERAGFGRVAYGVSKAGLIHLTRQLALELGPFGVTANAVGPGPVDTELARRAQTADMRADYLRTIPAGRYGTPEEIAGAVAFLCGPEAAYVNGQTLFVDGGFTAAGMGVAIAQAAART